MTIRVFVIDDHEIARLGLKKLFEGTEVSVIAENSGNDYALKMIEHLRPDVVLLDVRITNPEGNGSTNGSAGNKSIGWNLLSRIKTQSPELPVIMLSAYDNPTYYQQAISLSASGYLLKTTSREKMVAALQEVAGGETIFRRDELRRMTGALATPRTNADVEAPLTRRESEVLKFLCQGLTNREIAAKMQISYETVKEHVQHILQKIGVSDRTQAAVWAVRHQLDE